MNIHPGRNALPRAAVLAVLCLLAPAQAAVAGSDPREEAAVSKCFEDYRRAVLDQKGTTAVALVDANTIDYYDTVLILARTGSSDVVHRLSIMDKMMVLILRHMIPIERLNEMTGRSLFVYSVDQGWIGKERIGYLELGEIEVSGDYATAVYRSRGQSGPAKWRFAKEEGGWRLDITSVMPMTNRAFKQVIHDSGESEDDYLFALIESATGRALAESIWDPPAGSDQ